MRKIRDQQLERLMGKLLEVEIEMRAVDAEGRAEVVAGVREKCLSLARMLAEAGAEVGPPSRFGVGEG